MSSKRRMEGDNNSEPPETPDTQGPLASGGPAEAPAPPLLPELEELSPAAGTTPRAIEAAGGVDPTAWLAFLRNRLVLAGLAAVVVLLLIAVVLISFGSGNGEPRRRSAAGASSPDSEATVLPSDGLVGQVRTTTTMRNGPGPDYPILGTIPRGALVAVVGRSANQSWLQVTYPPGSQLRGWVSIAYIDVTGDIDQLAVAGPGTAASIAIPTNAAPVAPSSTPPTAAPAATEPPLPAATDTERPTRTPRPAPTRTPRAAATQTPIATATPQPTETAPPLPTETPKE